MVFHAAFRILGCAEDAEDVTQDVFLELFSHASLEAVDNLRAFLHRLTVYRCSTDGGNAVERWPSNNIVSLALNSRPTKRPFAAS